MVNPSHLLLSEEHSRRSLLTLIYSNVMCRPLILSANHPPFEFLLDKIVYIFITARALLIKEFGICFFTTPFECKVGAADSEGSHKEFLREAEIMLICRHAVLSLL